MPTGHDLCTAEAPSKSQYRDSHTQEERALTSHLFGEYALIDLIFVLFVCLFVFYLLIKGGSCYSLNLLNTF